MLNGIHPLASDRLWDLAERIGDRCPPSRDRLRLGRHW